MKAVDMLKALGVVLCVAVASSAYAQASDAMAETPANTAANKTVAKKVDRKLGLDVRKALSKTQGFDVSHVYVRARGGLVTLSGTVPDGSQIAQAGDVAKGVSGVTSVTNKITLRAPSGGGN